MSGLGMITRYQGRTPMDRRMTPAQDRRQARLQGLLWGLLIALALFVVGGGLR